LEGSQAGTFVCCLLWLQYIALVDPAAAKKAVRHHGLGKQIYEAYQDGQ
jgi:hypothetical protein